MQSNDNPLFNTKDFYQETTSASRGNVSGAMYYDPQKVQITQAQFDSEKVADSQMASARQSARNAQPP